jgi:hypothetical protein
VISGFSVTGIAGEIGITAFEFNGDDVQISMIMGTPCLIVNYFPFHHQSSYQPVMGQGIHGKGR